MIDLSTGELVGLLCAFVWALNSVIIRTQSFNVPPALMNAIRCAVSSLCFWVALALAGSVEVYAQISLTEWALLIGSVLVGVTLGDTLYLWSIREIGISRTMALVGTVPLTALMFEHVFLDQPFPASFVLGSFLVVGGVICLSLRSTGETSQDGRLLKGAVLSLSTSLLWGLSFVMIKPAIVNLTAIEANSVRMPIVALILFGVHRFANTQPVNISPRTIAIVAATGILGMGVGSYLFIWTIDMIGPAKTAVLGAFASVFAMGMAVVFLKERVTPRVAAGVLLCFVGVTLVL